MQMLPGIRILALIGLVSLIAGCVTKETSRSPFGRPAASTLEPETIALRNATTQPLRMIMVRETVDNPNAAQRLGRIEPAPAGTSAFFERSSNRQALPDRALVEWVTREGNAMSWEVDIERALRTATGALEEVLVFEVRSNGTASVYVTTLNQ